ncbi:MAG: hypothetical protein KDC38_10970, partial [Planctomycetes bacterium]|nr:hypothetical protein [Planctomycetota bacterium]
LGPLDAVTELRWIGPSDVLDCVRGAVRARRSLDVAGPTGAGRTTVLRAAAEEARREGRSVLWVANDDRPFAAMRSVSLDEPSPRLGRDEAVRHWTDELIRAIRQGGIVIADDWDRVDAPSREIIESCRSYGSIFRAIDDEFAADIVLRPLDEGELLELFHGPEHFLHLPSDGARVLHERTLGLPRLIRDELAAWVSSGLARWRGDRVELTRNSLDRLRSGLDGGASLLRLPRTPLGDVENDVLAWIDLAAPHATEMLLAEVTELPAWEVEEALRSLERRHAARRTMDGRWIPLVLSSRLAEWTDSDRANAHRRLDALASSDDARVRHLLAAASLEPESDVTRLGEEVVRFSEEQRQRGLHGPGRVAVQRALALLSPSVETRDCRHRLVREAALHALAEANPESSVLFADEIEGAHPEAEIRNLTGLVRAHAAALRGDTTTALEHLATIGRLEDRTLECWRSAVRVLAARPNTTPDEQQQLVDEAEATLSPIMTPAIRASLETWRAHAHYTAGRFREAGEAYLLASQGPVPALRRCSWIITAAEAFLEVPDLDRARKLAERGLQMAVECRSLVHEVRATHFWRSARYRACEELEVDEELVAAAREVTVAGVRAQVQLLEASVAWRSGDHQRTAQLGKQAQDDWELAGHVWPARLCAALVAMVSPPRDAEQVRQLLHSASGCPWPGLRVQIEAMACRAIDGQLTMLASREDLGFDGSSVDRLSRREVLSLEECFKGVE